LRNIFKERVLTYYIMSFDLRNIYCSNCGHPLSAHIVSKDSQWIKTSGKYILLGEHVSCAECLNQEQPNFCNKIVIQT